MRRADTKRVTMADVMVDETDLRNPATFPGGGSRSPYVCPKCTKRFSNTGWHFGTECGYPIMTDREAGAFLGAWLSGGYINPPEGRGTPRLIVRSEDKSSLGTLSQRLGVFGRHSFQMTKSDRYQLNTTPHPKLESLRNANPADVSLTREAVQTLFELRGSTEEYGVLIKGTENMPAISACLESHGIQSTVCNNQKMKITGEDAQVFTSWGNINQL